MIALGLYLAIFIAIIGSITYFVVEPPVRDRLQQNLDLRTQLLSSLIQEPLNSSHGLLNGIVGIAQSERDHDSLAKLIQSLFSTSSSIVVSGGVWPEPRMLSPDRERDSLFFNKAADGKIDKIESYNNPEASAYHEESWYTSVVNLPVGEISWSDVYIDPFTHVQMITVSAPYYLEGEFAGVTTVDLSLEGLLEFIKDHAEEYDLGITLRDTHGHVLVAHNFKLVEGIYISHIEFGEFNWKVEVVNSKHLVADEVFKQVMSVESGIVPFLLLCVMAGYYLLNRYLISPIIIIAKKVDDSKAGGIIDITYNSQDEIAHLIKAFNEKTIFLEAEKVKAQASTNAKTAFLATLSHEIRTPMNGVLGTAQILLKTKLDKDQEKHMKSLYDSGDHMMTLLNEILDFSKIEQGHLDLDFTSFPLDSIIGSINSVYHTLASEKGLQFKVYSEVPSGRWYYSDKARLRQVLFNLLNNAVKFTARGFVEVYLKETERDGKTYLSIRVRDTGIGISKEAQARIFKPFEQAESSTTRRFGGTGLGLAIVKKISALMGGDITVTSEEGIGTSFDVLVEMEPCKPGSVENIAHRKLNYSGLKVLIVEDNRTNTIIIETFMKSKGFECHSVENGELAVQAIVAERFDLVLMDNHMPVMDGVEATTAIRSLRGDMDRVLIFGCTADVFKETRERMLGAGVDYIVAKPIDERELDDALYRYAKKLYQYNPEQQPTEATSGSIEDTLVSFYIALEDSNFEAGSKELKKLLVLIQPNGCDMLKSAIQSAMHALDNAERPNQDDVNLITVKLSDF
ncbi:response regulator [Vibrio sp. T187]|uniref:hybrid sensor histidine kinase/response regulator n=1 Tax=Vibrio TaxID=662 RepID=UPI0010C9B963|nr:MULTISPECIES: hybrid sensor histidine kinase/response regulator [Vibrio]MBW3696649.1 response regulator [Vibrio sp. T187]